MIEQKASKLLHFFDRITLIEVTVDLQHPGRKLAEVRVDAEHKTDFVAHEEDEHVMPAVEKALTKMEHQIHRYKEKIQDHRRDHSAGEGG